MAKCINLNIHFNNDRFMSQRINDVPCVPRIGEMVRTEHGGAMVTEVIYDFDSDQHTKVNLMVNVAA